MRPPASFLLEHIVDRLGDGIEPRHPGTLSHGPIVQFFNERTRKLLPRCEPILGRHSVYATLDVERIHHRRRPQARRAISPVGRVARTLPAMSSEFEELRRAWLQQERARPARGGGQHDRGRCSRHRHPPAACPAIRQDACWDGSSRDRERSGRAPQERAARRRDGHRAHKSITVPALLLPWPEAARWCRHRRSRSPASDMGADPDQWIGCSAVAQAPDLISQRKELEIDAFGAALSLAVLRLRCWPNFAQPRSSPEVGPAPSPRGRAK